MLIQCTVYRDGRKSVDIGLDQIEAHLQDPRNFVWVALHDATAGEMARLQSVFGLHPLAVEDALSGLQRPKVEEYGDALFAVMHLLTLDAASSPHALPQRLHAGQLAVFAGPRHVVSVRNRSEQSLAAVRARCEREPDLLRQGPGFVLYALMDEVVDRYVPLTEHIEEELEAIERQIFTEGAGREIARRLYALKRRLRMLRHAVAPLLEAAARLHSGRVPPLCAQTQHYFRDVFDHLSRISVAIDSTRDTITTAIQVNLSLVTIDDSEVTKKLAAWAAIFAVCTAFVGVWGMNFERMPELHWRWGYPAALALIAAVCGVLYARFRRAGWL